MINSIKVTLILLTLIALSLTVRSRIDDKFNISDRNPPDPNHPIPNCQENAKAMITMINSIKVTLILLTLITLSLTVKKTPTLFIRSPKFICRCLQFAIGASLHRCYGLGPGGSSSLTTDALSSLSGYSSADASSSRSGHSSADASSSRSGHR